MYLSRRQFIESGIAAGAVTAVSATPALAGAFDRTVPTVPIAPTRIMVDPAIDPSLLARARTSFARHRNRLRYVDMVGIADFSKPSALPRFYLLDTNSGRVTSHLVAHGRGSDPEHSGWLQRFSNSMGSNASSNGAYVTGDFYQGRYGRSMRVSGLDYSNSNAHARAIVVHSAWYAEPAMVQDHGKLGRSEGCFALPGVSHAEAMTRMGSGRLLYAERA